MSFLTIHRCSNLFFGFRCLFLFFLSCFLSVISLCDSWGAECGLYQTRNLQKPNPPTPLPCKGRGVLKPLPLQGRGLERGQSIHSKLFKHPLRVIPVACFPQGITYNLILFCESPITKNQISCSQ